MVEAHTHSHSQSKVSKHAWQNCTTQMSKREVKRNSPLEIVLDLYINAWWQDFKNFMKHDQKIIGTEMWTYYMYCCTQWEDRSRDYFSLHHHGAWAMEMQSNRAANPWISVLLTSLWSDQLGHDTTSYLCRRQTLYLVHILPIWEVVVTYKSYYTQDKASINVAQQ